MPLRPLTLAALAICLASPAPAGPIADLAATIENDIATGHAAEAVRDGHSLMDRIWPALPLGFTKVLLVADHPGGYGLYTARKNDVFKPGEPILIYAEPYGFGYGTTADGLSKIAFDVSMVIRTPEGKVIGGMNKGLRLSTTSHHRNKEFEATLTYRLSGIDPGKYVIVTTMLDRNSDKTGTFETPIEIAP